MSKRTLFLSDGLCRHSLATNVFGLGEGGEKKAPKFKFSTNANRKYKCSA